MDKSKVAELVNRTSAERGYLRLMRDAPDAEQRAYWFAKVSETQAAAHELTLTMTQEEIDAALLGK